MSQILFPLIKDLPKIVDCSIKNLSNKLVVSWAVERTSATQFPQEIFFDVLFNRESWTLLGTALQPMKPLLLRSLRITYPLSQIEKIEIILKKTPHLESLFMKDCEITNTFSFFRTLGSFCRQLKQLSLPGGLKASKLHLEGLSFCKELEELDLSHTYGEMEVGFIKFISQAGKSLKKLVLYNCSSFSESCLVTLSNHCPALQTLNIGKCYMLTGSSLKYLDSLSLKSLFIDEMDLKESDVHLHFLSKLKELSLRKCTFSESTLLKIVTSCVSLEKLYLEEKEITWKNLEVLIAKAKSLTTLYVIGCSLSEKECLELQARFSIKIYHESLFFS